MRIAGQGAGGRFAGGGVRPREGDHRRAERGSGQCRERGHAFRQGWFEGNRGGFGDRDHEGVQRLVGLALTEEEAGDARVEGDGPSEERRLGSARFVQQRHEVEPAKGRAGREMVAPGVEFVRGGEHAQGELDARSLLRDIVLDVADETFGAEVGLGGEGQQQHTQVEDIEAAHVTQAREGARAFGVKQGDIVAVGRVRGALRERAGERRGQAVGLGIGDVEAAVVVLAHGDARFAHARDFEHEQAMDERDAAFDIGMERGAHQQVTVMPERKTCRPP